MSTEKYSVNNSDGAIRPIPRDGDAEELHGEPEVKPRPAIFPWFL